ncbi:MAG: hypothetical protein NTX45_01565 [Proteobacteria bacterium]|nr:hypothetical protein [Pseudomonadota bacterium]
MEELERLTIQQFGYLVRRQMHGSRQIRRDASHRRFHRRFPVEDGQGDEFGNDKAITQL